MPNSSSSSDESKRDENSKKYENSEDSKRGNQTTGKKGNLTARRDDKKGTTPRKTESTPRDDKKAAAAGDKDKSEDATPRSPNKIYRTPPTPAPGDLFVRERAFTLDCIAVNTTSNDFAKAKPKLGQVTRPYNSQKDKNIDAYFNFLGINTTLKKTGQPYPGSSIEGPVVDRFFETGAGYRYLSTRNKHGCGRSTEEADGHAQFMQNLKPVLGYNGKYGYRRNNPWLRQTPSPFGVGTLSPIH